MTDHSRNDPYEESGWILLRGSVRVEELASLKLWADGLERCGSCLKYYEVLPNGQRVLSRVERFLEFDSPVGHLIRPSSELMHVISGLLQDEAILFKDKINFKPPGGGAYTLHQDAPAYAGFGISDFITAMVAIDRASLINGCLQFAVGSRVKRAFEVDDLGRIVHSDVQTIQFAPVSMDPGDVIIFDGLAPHKSDPNCSDSARRALFLTFNRKKEGNKRTEYYAAKCELFPPEDQRQAGRDYRKIGRQFNLGNPFQ